MREGGSLQVVLGLRAWFADRRRNWNSQRFNTECTEKRFEDTEKGNYRRGAEDAEQTFVLCVRSVA